ncbi:MAG TPA: RluA family pseudouridine synthase [Myxococcota bacterium]|nr:RluA family pseudouridine synthase [Myxococcota bacterium]
MTFGDSLARIIRFEDQYLVVVDKPAGLPSQAGVDGRPGVYELLGERHRYVGLHHRLDVSASGLMVLSLSKKANRGLAHQIQARRLDRRYQVLVLGDPGDEGVWTAPIDHREAETHWRALRRGTTSLIEARLVTGRTHQIRLHALGAGHPVLGDRRHGGAAGRLSPRLALHAWRLGLQHPVTGEALRFESPAEFA